MALRGAGLSFKIAHPTTHVLTEIATYFSDFGADASAEELTASTFAPGELRPTTEVLYGSTTRTFTLSGFWSPAAEALFSALDGAQGLAYEQAPQGTAVGKTKIVGSCNFGAWSGPVQTAPGLITMTINMSVTSRKVETIAAPGSTVAITSSSVADPTLVTAAAPHLLETGDVVTIAGHTGSTPDINGSWVATVLTATTFTIPVNVTVGGTGGTLLD